MAFLQWRRFSFFDKEVVKDPETNQPFDKLKDLHITCSTNGRGNVVLGDVEGNLHFLNRQFQLSSFKAFELNVSHIQQLRHNGILVSVGSDEPGINPLIKIWNLEKTDRTGKPACLRTIRIQVGSTPVPVTALAVHENLNLMAVGLDQGRIIIFKGDITRERQCKQKEIPIGTDSVTGLAFRKIHSNKLVYLFVSTTDEVFSVDLTDKNNEKIKLLDGHGCRPKCSVMSDAKKNCDDQFVVGRNDAIYFYQPDERGPCFAFEGEKVILHWFRGNLVVVGKDNKAIPSLSSSGSSVEMSIVTVYDIQNKFIAYSAPFSGIVNIVSEWGMLFILNQDGKLFSLQEKDTQSKLEMLFKKNQYSLAISLAKSQNYDDEGLVDIFRQYGDHLYSKGDHDGAIVQYIKTIGKLEASYVIRKFLDAQRIHNLTAYLQALHKKGLANEDHTTLLLNCYTKLKDIDKLDEFIKTEKVDFDVEIAIKVCRQAGYFTHALFLAEKHHQHDWYLKIQLEDLKDYSKALDYIGKLDFSLAEDNMKKYGKILINNALKETTDLLKRLCTDFKSNNETIQRAQPEEFIHIFVNNTEKLLEFLQHMVRERPSSSALVYNTLLELQLQSWKAATVPAVKEQLEKDITTSLTNSEAKYDVDQAMVLCQMNDFKYGVLCLYEKAKLYQQILQYHIKHNDYKNIIETCKNFGLSDPNLWIEALRYFSQKDQNECSKEKEKVLKEIEDMNLLPPIMVVDIMAESKTAMLDSVVKDYLIRHLEHENNRIASDKRLIKQYREETEKMRNQIEELKTNAKIFQVSKCSGCTHQLELPSVHFLCGHSYHQQCFESYNAENDSECPLCMHENRKVLDIIHSQEQSKDLHEQFHHQLERAEDSFSVVADYFGRGVFNTVTLLTDMSPYNKPSIPKHIAM
ncbi:vacuolar protein sorting-associated protein 11 homolog [Centruroides sculpturatus]|uniref:vacuolar protein sorting-associated protein 11 homolog n=1 Tax=Centruroides sculpturatus TaxID=218467 RepID=UPI000C6E4D3A|nr:vacuolar protein sorting-associated protein 11 homolog [Centruroides sculpturatus]XP_023243543.1 vacuolar protein sorting-associated protein 11 homolog [Centruroides sculpturatus]